MRTKKRKELRHCRWCRRLIGFRTHSAMLARLYSLGIQKNKFGSLTPACHDCLTKHLTSGKEIVLPQVKIAEFSTPLRMCLVPPDHWPEVYTEIGKHDFVCVRVEVENAPMLLVVTTAPLAVSVEIQSTQAARVIENAIFSRPKGTETRFVASLGWGGSSSVG